jgi:hypothetical protein
VSAVIITGVPPWDGRYDFDDFGLTNRELFRVKVVSEGIRASELIEALDANDTAAYVGFAVAIMERHGKNVDPKDLWDAPVGSISIDLGTADDADPPTPIATAEGSSGSDASSGPDSENDGA